MKNGRTKACAVLFAGMLAVSCANTASSGTQLDAAEVAEKYGYNSDPSLSLTAVYVLVPEYKDLSDRYARMLLLKECMAGVLEIHTMPPLPDTATTVFDPRSGERRLTAEIAHEWGYQIPPPLGKSPTALDSTLSDDEVLAMQYDCGDKTDELLGMPPARFLGDVEEAGWAYAELSSLVVDAAVEWRNCMEPLGVIDLPESPLFMPSPSVVTVGVQGGDVEPSEREVEVALGDAECRAQSSYTATLRSERSVGELEAIGKDIEGFEAVRQQFQEYQVGVDNVLQELG